MAVFGKRGKIQPILWGHKNPKKYVQPSFMYSFNHKGTKIRISQHRLFMTYFVRPPLEGETVNHKDGNRLNNCLDNLEWLSVKDNILHAFDTKLSVGSAYRIVKAVDVKTKKVWMFPSINQAHKWLNVNAGNIHYAIKYKSIIKGYSFTEMLKDSPTLTER